MLVGAGRSRRRDLRIAVQLVAVRHVRGKRDRILHVGVPSLCGIQHFKLTVRIIATYTRLVKPLP